MTVATKIQKLIALADSTTHPEEADTFMSKAHALMTEHGLNLLDLGKLSEDPVAVDKDAYDHAASYSFMPKLASAAAKYYGVDWARFKQGNRMLYSVAGRESARMTFMLMMPYLEREVKRVAREQFNEGHYSSRIQAATRVGNALALRIFDMARASHVKDAEGEGVNALVPVDLTEQALAEAFPRLKKGRAVKVGTDSVARNAVKNINLNAQTTGAATKRLT